MAWYGMAWHDKARHGVAWHGMAWYDMAWHGIAGHPRQQDTRLLRPCLPWPGHVSLEVLQASPQLGASGGGG